MNKRESFYRLKAEHFLKLPDNDADPLAPGDHADPRWRQSFSDQQLRATIAGTSLERSRRSIISNPRMF
jgi:hypothetical protein